MIPESPDLLVCLLSAALRALVAAAAVWIGIRALRIGNVVAQKVAWTLVLVASLVIPFIPRHVLPAWADLRVPATLSMLPDRGPSPAPSTRFAASPVQTSAPAFQSSSSALDGRSAKISQRTVAPSSASTILLNARLAASDRSPSGQSDTPITTARSGPPASAAEIANTAPNRIALLAILFYLAVVAVLFLRLLAGTFAAIRLWITAQPVTALAIDHDSTRIRASERVSSPVNIGSGILLPADYSDWDEEKLRIVLAHERSHIRQGDFYLQLAAGLYTCVFWFSPLGWWLKRKLCELGEAISDRAGLEKAASRTSYAQLLLEFAALPRPTLTGVAMARTNHLSQRIERLLDESHFRRAFAAAGRRAWLAAVIVPLVLFAATTLVGVQAATSGTQTTTPSAASGQSTPEQVSSQAPDASPAPAAAPEAQAAPIPNATSEPAPQAAPALPGAPAAAPAPPEPPAFAVQPGAIGPLPPSRAVTMGPNGSLHLNQGSSGFYVNPGRLDADTERLAQSAEMAADMMVAKAQSYLYRTYDGAGVGADCTDQNGDPYAVVDSDGKIVTQNSCSFAPERFIATEKARNMAHGAFLLFEHDGKPYIVDDPAIVDQIQAMEKPMDEIRTQMQALGKQMRELGAQQRDMGQKMRDVSVPTPDLSKEIADLNAAAANLKAKEGGSISQKDLGEMQREIGRIQGQLGQLQGKIGAQQGDLGGQMGKFGSQMGALGGQMGELGGKMGKLAHENQEKMKGIINDSLSNGKAKPVQ